MPKSISIGESIIKLDTIDSTNSYASCIIRNKKLAEGTVILAEHQTEGKGQSENKWLSEPGKNLTFSIILYPSWMNVKEQFYLSMVISNALVDYLKDQGIRSQIKWPNDICCDQGKIAGILIENTVLNNMIRSSVIGVGLNVNQRVFPEDLNYATSMFILTGSSFKLDTALDGVLGYIRMWTDQLYLRRYGPIRTRYISELMYLNEWKSYKDASGNFEGRIVDVAESGELLIRKRNGELQSYRFKEIIPAP